MAERGKKKGKKQRKTDKQKTRPQNNKKNGWTERT